MIVEDHEIVESFNGPPILTITGRSLDSFLESRVATDDQQGFDNPTVDGYPGPYRSVDQYPSRLLQKMLEDQLVTGLAVRSNFAVPDLLIKTAVNVSEATDLMDGERGNLSKIALGILEEIDAGIRVDRPSVSRTSLDLVIHDGTDKTQSVRFSWKRGDIETAKYFWSNRNHRNAAYVSSKFQGRYMNNAADFPEPSGLTRRVAHFYLDDIATKPTTPTQVTDLNKRLKNRAKKKLGKLSNNQILEATISKDSKFKFMQHYNIGDKVYLLGNYGVSSAMRVVEYILSEDKSGSFGYPVLKPVSTNATGYLGVGDEGFDEYVDRTPDPYPDPGDVDWQFNGY